MFGFSLSFVLALFYLCFFFILYPLSLVPSIPEERTTDLSHLNERQIRCLGMIYNEDKALSRKHYAEILHTSIRSAQRDLRELLDEGLLKEEGKARSLRYVKP